MEEKPPGQTACLYISSIFFVTIAISTLSFLRLLISICHYEYTNGKTVCAPQNVVLEKLPIEIPSKTIFLRIGGLEYSAGSESINGNLPQDFDSYTEHQLGFIDANNFSRFKDLKELALIKCGISGIEKMAFSNLSKLKTLDLRFNKITFLEESAFTGLNLTLLDLSHNFIVKLSALAFSGSSIKLFILTNSSYLTHIEPFTFSNSSFEDLNIESSSLSDLTSETFDGLANSLKRISITNQLTPLNIQKNIFENFTSLQSINFSNASLIHIDFLTSIEADEIVLDHNDVKNASDYFSDSEGTIFHNKTKKLSLANARLSFLPTFVSKSYMNLISLDLSSNKYITVDASEFSNLKHLQVLDLSANNISTITSFNNQTLPHNLTSLFLHSNNIRTLPEETYNLLLNLHNFSFYENVLHCNCEAKWLANFIKNHTKGKEVVMNWQKINCSTPSNQSLVEVDPEEFVCTPPGELKTWHKEMLEEKGVVLYCQVTSDPASNITWSNDHKQDHNISHYYPNLFNIFKITDNFSKDTNSTSDRNKSSESRANVHKIVLEVLVFVDEYTTRSQLFVTSPGNYTCQASNIVASINYTFNTDSLQLTGEHFSKRNEKIESRSNFEGILLVALFIILIGFLPHQ